MYVTVCNKVEYNPGFPVKCHIRAYAVMPWLWSCACTPPTLALCCVWDALTNKSASIVDYHVFIKLRTRGSIPSTIDSTTVRIHYTSHSGKRFTFEEAHSTGNKCEIVMLLLFSSVLFVQIPFGVNHKRDSSSKWKAQSRAMLQVGHSCWLILPQTEHRTLVWAPSLTEYSCFKPLNNNKTALLNS